MMRYWHLVFLVLLVGGCSRTSDDMYTPEFSEKSTLQETEYIFGVHPLHNPQRLFEVFDPMMDYLSKHIDGATFKLEASRNYAAYDKKLYARHFDFSLPNPFQTMNAIDKGYRVFGKMGDDENFRGIILVRKDSGITSVRDLKGKAVSYPAPTALAATMMPQYYIQTHGVDVMTELDNRYVGSQESSIMNVFLGETIAGSTWPPPWNALRKERPELDQQLQVIWETEPLINNGLVALDTIPENIVKQVQTLLTGLHQHGEGKKILSRMELSRFETANDATYDVVRQFIKTFSRDVRVID